MDDEGDFVDLFYVSDNFKKRNISCTKLYYYFFHRLTLTGKERAFSNLALVKLLTSPFFFEYEYFGIWKTLQARKTDASGNWQANSTNCLSSIPPHLIDYYYQSRY